MSLQFFNTRSRSKEIFTPIHEGKVGMYSCGPTVYNYVHIGNLRAYVFVDLLKRYLSYKGYDVTHIMNITDVDDKTIRDSQKEKLPFQEFTEKYTKAFLDDLASLNILPADMYPKATEHIEEMLEIVSKLEEKGLAYVSNDGSVYYDISKDDAYGGIAQLEKQHLKENADNRLNASDEYEKDDFGDFALWKSWTDTDGDVFWDTKYGKSRPGWHIECSAMSMKYLGKTFDIHTGGVDLIFPHHTNEIAQSENVTNEPFVNYWMHNEHLLVEGKKMSKSLNNFHTLSDIVAMGYRPILVRFALIKNHYRQKLNFTFADLHESQTVLLRYIRLYRELTLHNTMEQKTDFNTATYITQARQDIEKALDDDLNISEALAAFNTFISVIEKNTSALSLEERRNVVGFIDDVDAILGLIGPSLEEYEAEISKAVENESIVEMVNTRQQARENKNFELADKVRDELAALHIEIRDSKEGSTIELQSPFITINKVES